MVANAKTTKNKGFEAKGKDSTFRIRKREFLKDLAVGPETNGFTCQKIEINPGLDTSFPWVSQVAPSFSKYRLKNLTFEYETAVSTFSPGMVMMAPQFNISKSLPTNKTQLLELAYATRAPLWENFSLNISKAESNVYKEYFVRGQDPPLEPKLYDPLYLIVGSDSIDLDRPYYGELWISYEIELFEPVYVSQAEVEIGNYKIYQFTNVANTNPFTTVANQQGLLAMSLVDLKTIKFEEDFTGTILCLVDSANIGNASSIDTIGFAPVPVSDSGTIQGPLGVGGNGFNSSTNGYTMWIFGAKDFIIGDTITFNTFGFFADSGSETASSAQLWIMKGIDWLSPPQGDSSEESEMISKLCRQFGLKRI